jgi:hypothetical protein
VGQAGEHVKNRERAMKGSVLLDHHFSSFDDGGYRVALLELEFVSTAAGDGALNEVVADPNDHMGHDIAQLNFFNFSTQFVSS